MKLETLFYDTTDVILLPTNSVFNLQVLLWNSIFAWFQFWQSKKKRKRVLAALFSKPMYLLQAALYTIHFQVLGVGCKGVESAYWEMKAGFWACGNYFFNPWLKNFWNVKYFKYFLSLIEGIKTLNR